MTLVRRPGAPRTGRPSTPPNMEELANLFKQAEEAKQVNRVKSMSLSNIHKIVSTSNAFETKVLPRKPHWINGERRASVPVRLLKGDKNGKQTESYLLSLQQGRNSNPKLLNHVSKFLADNKEIKAVTKIQALVRSYLARKVKPKKKAKKL